ncbi:MAG: hypothetical protein K9J37_14845 [Saprospiraceae bacterium]|nr:hypothetical protein [Saprospiraceae bacterium]MCF8251186.1 hypothetical protein [Saprospiraceae bacterium]MCF8282381.1 hypothetical protein [Bacteroidales bacterium]MCF8312998.1 hypothetical protein [Saprospiraceae bacterium]MCF8441445.1 hypothetical protein [Saprospiraceae bacterium]
MKVILPLFFLFSTSLLNGQSNFPAAWSGNWSGKLEIFNATGKLQELPMELQIWEQDTVPETYSFIIIYGEDKVAGKRDYQLITMDSAKGRYLMDEKNSIKMEAYYLNGKLVQWFEVEGTMLYTTTELVGEELLWEIISGSSTPVSTTGNETVDGEEIPPVRTFPVGAMQRARLRRG